MLSAGSRFDGRIGSRTGDGLQPPDPSGLLTTMGLLVYDWDLRTDALSWGGNAAGVLGLPDLSGYSSGSDFARLIEDDGAFERRAAVLGRSAADAGSGVPYAVRYGIRPRPDRLLVVEETGRWYGGSDGQPAVAHGTLRISEPPAASGDGHGQRERSAFLRSIGPDVLEAGRSKRPLTLFVISVENLAELNEACGYDAADVAISALLDRLTGVMRRRDGFVRLAGNRFALGLRACPPEQARLVGERLDEAAMAASVDSPGGPIEVRLLIGAATAPDHAADASELLRRAEQSLVVAKRRLGATFVIYDPQIFRAHERRTADPAATDVVGLLNTRRIAFALQPIVEAGTRALAFSEALLRVEESGRIVAAGDVVPAMERSGLVPLVDMRVMELVAAHLAAEPAARASINLSPLTLDSPDWLATLAAHVGRSRTIASRLIVEVTETVAIRDPDATRRKFDAMKALGVSLAIDDFGAGHTSFRHLRSFPVDIVKIDGAFVQNLLRSTDDQYFVRTLVDLAHHLGMATVAEWVEDEETACLLAEWGVDYLQGDHCGVPQLVKPTEVPARTGTFGA